mmetsp:Transcript_10396/g.20409  ORF Transcript_10396/g.20409 Transcript_10396/m.20409 type:complete len:311 (-) Transcript_10396:184-1116(-)
MLFGLFCLIPFLTFFIPFIYRALLHSPQDLKKKYNAEWALVTGASSGIGKAIVERLCGQGLNVVMVALDDATLKEAHAEMQKRFPMLKVMLVGADLSRDGYLKTIADKTKDIKVSLVFNNAGFMLTGMFADTAEERILGNYECNATSALRITHLFTNRMLDTNTKGLISFTSSPAGCIPNPFAVMYGSTKAFLTEFAVSLAPELRSKGIDVCVVHPSPVNSLFYSAVPSKHMISAISFFKSTGTSPFTIADVILANAGRTVLIEQGYFCVFVRGLILKIIDLALFADLIARFAHMMPDFKKVAVDRKKAK